MTSRDNTATPCTCRATCSHATNLLILVTAAAALAACSSPGQSPSVTPFASNVSSPARVNAATSVAANAPLTLFEQRRLLNRIAADPQRQLQRLSPRERRGLAAMAEATKKKDDNE